jgi:hypothetical protein
MCTPVWISFSSTCAPIVVFGRVLRKWSAYQHLLDGEDLQCESFAVLDWPWSLFPARVYVIHYTLSNVIECLYMGLYAHEN